MAGILQERLKEAHKKQVQPEESKNKKKELYPSAEKFHAIEEPEYIREPSEKETMDEEEYEMLQEMEKMLSEEKQERHEKRKKKILLLIQGVLSAACIYLVILIYGVLITQYQYDQLGKIEPVVLSVEEISNRNEYNNIVGMYLQVRNLYQEILALDYRVASGVEDPMLIAPEYEDALDLVSALAVQIDAAPLSTKYNQVKSMLLTWVQMHAAAYCQYMSSAISQNDSGAASEAIACREVVYSNFQLITQNIIILGKDIKSYDVTELTEWSPDGYIQKVMEGIE